MLEEAVDSVFKVQAEAKIVVMGDMNAEDLEVKGLKDERMKGEGTHKYQGRWTCLDHFYAEIYNAAWIQEPDEKYLDLKPKRTYNGFRYQKDGFSDHLPIVLTVSL